MTRLFKASLPLIIFAALAFFLWRGLSLNPRHLPSALINKPAPQFQLATVETPGATFSKKDLLGQVSLVNVWATWCVACREDHPVLMDIAAHSDVPIYGLDYKDDQKKAQQWLKVFGNPYQKIGFDASGNTAINWGVYGTPETFLVDKHGVIRYKQIGPMTHQVWQEKFLPLIKQLRAS